MEFKNFITDKDYASITTEELLSLNVLEQKNDFIREHGGLSVWLINRLFLSKDDNGNNVVGNKLAVIIPQHKHGPNFDELCYEPDGTPTVCYICMLLNGWGKLPVFGPSLCVYDDLEEMIAHVKACCGASNEEELEEKSKAYLLSKENKIKTDEGRGKK